MMASPVPPPPPPPPTPPKVFKELFSALAHHQGVLSSSAFNAYGTLIFKPPPPLFQFDFGPPQWPCPIDKSAVCARVLLIQSWVDGCFGFVGGGSQPGEESSPTLTMAREFEEEVGTRVEFTDDDFVFAVDRGGRMTFTFAKVTSDKSLFESVVSSFHATTIGRAAFINEIFTVTSLPLWVESDSSKQNAPIWGLPRILLGGMLTPTLSNSRAVRDDLVAILIIKGVIEKDEMKRRVFDVANELVRRGGANMTPLPEFDLLCARFGL